MSLVLLFAACLPDADKAETGASEDSAVPTDTGCRPAIEATPSAIDFGSVDVGDALTETVTVTNVGCAALEVRDVYLLDPEGADVVSMSAIGSVLVPPGSSTSFTVTFSPEAPFEASNSVLVDSNDPTYPTVEIELVGEGVAPDIVVDPAATDLGELGAYCEGETEITLANQGNAVLVVADLASGGTGVTVDPREETNGPLPWSLAPFQSVKVGLSLEAVEGANEACVIVASNDPDTPEAEACVTATGVTTEVTDTFVVEHPEVDILFVLDWSCSAADRLPELVASWESFLEALDAEYTDYQLAVVGEEDGCLAGGTSWVDPSMAREDQVAALEAMSSAPSGEQGFSRFSVALAATGAGGCNEGLVRGGRLALVGATDEAEQSPGVWSDYVAEFQTYVTDPADLTVNGFLSATDMAGWSDAVIATGGAIQGIDTTDWDASLEGMAESISPDAGHVPGGHLDLSTRADPDSIVVTVDGVESSAWEYASTDIAVELDEEPANGTVITVTYTAAACLD